MKPQSAKSKGRNLQKLVRDKIYATFKELSEGDVESRSMGAAGTDLLLSPLAKKYFPFSVECKNQESLNFWASFKQAEENLLKDTMPLLIAKRNRSDVLAVLKFDDLMKLIKKEN